MAGACVTESGGGDSRRLGKLRAHREQVLAAARRHGAHSVRVFGSVARGTDGPDSDIDLLVDLDVHVVGLLPLGALAEELSLLLDERVDVVASGALAPEVARSALREAVPL